MKKFLLVAVLAVASLAAYAQPRAVGVNLGPWSSFSYQHGFGETNMLDLAANVILPINSGVGVGGHVTYDWIDPFNAPVPWNEKGEWHWYMGVGGAFQTTWTNPGLGFIGVAGRFGIEYDFWFPLQLSLDFRPTLGVNMGGNPFGAAFGWDLYAGAIGLGIRYKF